MNGVYRFTMFIYIIYKIQNTYNIFMYRYVYIYMYKHTSIICKKYQEPRSSLGPNDYNNTSSIIHPYNFHRKAFPTSPCKSLQDFPLSLPGRFGRFPKISGSFSKQIPWFKIRAGSWWVELSPIKKHAQVVFGFPFPKDRGDFFF